MSERPKCAKHENLVSDCDMCRAYARMRQCGRPDCLHWWDKAHKYCPACGAKMSAVTKCNGHELEPDEGPAQLGLMS